MALSIGNWSYKPYKWSYGYLLLTGRGPPWGGFRQFFCTKMVWMTTFHEKFKLKLSYWKIQKQQNWQWEKTERNRQKRTKKTYRPNCSLGWPNKKGWTMDSNKNHENGKTKINLKMYWSDFSKLSSFKEKPPTFCWFFGSAFEIHPKWNKKCPKNAIHGAKKCKENGNSTWVPYIWSRSDRIDKSTSPVP